MLRDLRDAWGWIQRLVRRVERVESGAFLENSSITNGRMRFIGGLLLIDSGGTLQVIGTASVTGTLTGSGTFDWTGPMNLQGAQSITGPTTFTGQMTVNGPWKMVGNGQITGDVGLTGKLTAGNVTIEPSTAGGRIGLGSGRTIDAGSGFLAIRDGARFVVFNSSGVAINGGAGSPTFFIGASGVSISGLAKVTRAGIPDGCIYKGSDGNLYEG